MKKKRKLKLKKQGFLESPLVLGLIKLIPTVLITTAVLVGVNNLILTRNEKVLGSETNLPRAVQMTKQERIYQLRELSKTVKSEEIDKEIERLLAL